MSELREKAAATLPTALQPIFYQLVEDYQAAARTHVPGRQPWINYNILADLLRSGWRKDEHLWGPDPSIAVQAKDESRIGPLSLS
jgi:hypothetical protein